MMAEISLFHHQSFSKNILNIETWKCVTLQWLSIVVTALDVLQYDFCISIEAFFHSTLHIMRDAKTRILPHGSLYVKRTIVSNHVKCIIIWINAFNRHKLWSDFRMYQFAFEGDYRQICTRPSSDLLCESWILRYKYAIPLISDIYMIVFMSVFVSLLPL